ncbi:MAG: hypothetical protein EPN64_04435 [Burkholderiaceae bacterium]|nr:MAG: hypothetical protein EPN64_04435 [Burkholderiaceae bacterium]
MSHMTAFTRSFVLRSAAALIILGSLAACGGGGDVTVAASVQPVVAPLTLVLTRVGPEAVELDWSDDPDVASFLVLRDGYPLATVTSTTSLIDTSVLVDGTYCYQVQGDDAAGQLVAATSSGCITIVP